MKARKKPIVIDFFELNGKEFEDYTDLISWVNTFNQAFNDHFIVNDQLDLKVKTLGTSYDITSNDMILRGINGEFYPCKKDIFYNTYEVLPDERDRNR